MSCIFLPAVHSLICPVDALRSSLAACSHVQGPLFMLADGCPLKTSMVRSILFKLASISVIPTESSTSHAFCIGAATTVAAIGVPDEVIDRRGCWSSRAYLSYIRCSINWLWSLMLFRFFLPARCLLPATMDRLPPLSCQYSATFRGTFIPYVHMTHPTSLMSSSS